MSRLAVPSGRTDSKGKPIYQAPKGNEFVSQDKSKPYYGQVVQQSEVSGKIVPAEPSVEVSSSDTPETIKTKVENIAKDYNINKEETQNKLERQVIQLRAGIGSPKYQEEQAQKRDIESSKKEAPEWMKKAAEKTFRDEPYANKVWMEDEGTKWEFTKGKSITFREGESTISALKSEEFTTIHNINTPLQAQAKTETNKYAKYFLSQGVKWEEFGKSQTGIKRNVINFGVGVMEGTSDVIKHPVQASARLVTYYAAGRLTGGVGIFALSEAEILANPSARAEISSQLSTNPMSFIISTAGRSVPYIIGTGALSLTEAGVRSILPNKVTQNSVTYEPVKIEHGGTQTTSVSFEKGQSSYTISGNRAYIGYEYGSNAPSVGVGKTSGVIKGESFKGSSVSVGKVNYGTLKTSKYDIFYKQTSEGTMLNYFRKGSNTFVKQEFVEPSKPMSYYEDTSTKGVIGMGGDSAKGLFFKSTSESSGFNYKGNRFSESSEFLNVKDVSTTSQLDVAGNYFEKTLIYPDSQIFTIEKGKIVYSKNPSYKPNTFTSGVERTGNTFQQIDTSIKNPSLATLRQTITKTYVDYTASSGLKGWGKKASLFTETEQVLKPEVETMVKPQKTISPEITFLNMNELKNILGTKTEPLIVPVSSVKIEPILETRNRADTKTIIGVKSKASTKPESIIETKTESIVETIPKAETIVKTKSRAETQTKTETIVDTITNIITTPKTPPSTPTFTFTPPPTPPPSPFEFKPPEEYRQKGGLFKVSVRKRGVFKPIGTATGLKEAFGMGKVAVESTASASFKIEGGEITGDSFLPKNKFYRSRKETNVFIQKRSQRISSAGEKREITYKGIMFNKLKGKGFGLFGG